MTAGELLHSAREKYPQRRFALSRSQAALGCWEPSIERFVPVAMLTITGEWHQTPPILVNGQPIVKDVDWIESE